MTTKRTPRNKLAGAVAAVRRVLVAVVDDALALGGLAAIIHGSFLLHAVVGWYVVGLVLLGAGWLVAGMPTPPRRGR